MRWIVTLFYCIFSLIVFSQSVSTELRGTKIPAKRKQPVQCTHHGHEPFKRASNKEKGGRNPASLESVFMVDIHQKRPRPRLYSQYQHIDSFYSQRANNRVTYNGPNVESPSYTEFDHIRINNRYLRETEEPLDNTIAVNWKDQLIHISNDGAVLMMPNGQTMSTDLPDLFKQQLLYEACDPRVIIDPESNRFIIVAQEAHRDFRFQQPGICIAVSDTDDATKSWSLYFIPGEENKMFDYPSVSITNNDLIISGTLYELQQTDENSVEMLGDAILYQIDKETLLSSPKKLPVYPWSFKGTNLSMITTVRSYDNSTNYAPPLFIATDWEKGRRYLWLYEITASVNSEPSDIRGYAINTDYETQYFARTPVNDSDSMIDNLDFRIFDAYIKDDILVYVNLNGNEYFQSKIRLNTIKLSFQNNSLHRASFKSVELGKENQTSYMFPSVSYVEDKDGQERIVVYYSGAQKYGYPNSYCTDCSLDLNCREEMVIATSQGELQSYDIGREAFRWGDYTTIAKHPSKELLFFSGTLKSKYVGQLLTESVISEFHFDTEKKNIISNEVYKIDLKDSVSTTVIVLIDRKGNRHILPSNRLTKDHLQFENPSEFRIKKVEVHKQMGKPIILKVKDLN